MEQHRIGTKREIHSLQIAGVNCYYEMTRVGNENVRLNSFNHNQFCINRTSITEADRKDHEIVVNYEGHIKAMTAIQIKTVSKRKAEDDTHKSVGSPSNGAPAPTYYDRLGNAHGHMLKCAACQSFMTASSKFCNQCGRSTEIAENIATDHSGKSHCTILGFATSHDGGIYDRVKRKMIQFIDGPAVSSIPGAVQPAPPISRGEYHEMMQSDAVHRPQTENGHCDNQSVNRVPIKHVDMPDPPAPTRQVSQQAGDQQNPAFRQLSAVPLLPFVRQTCPNSGACKRRCHLDINHNSSCDCGQQRCP